MPSEHLKFIIPGAILAAVGGLMLFFGFIFFMIFHSGWMYGYGSGGFSVTILIVGAILLLVGVILLAKGISAYRTGQVAYYKNRAAARSMQPVAYAPSPGPSYAPSYTPSYAPVTQTPPKFDTSSVILDTPSVIQDPTPPKQTLTQEKKYCPSCGAALPEGSQAHFCPACGGPI